MKNIKIIVLILFLCSVSINYLFAEKNRIFTNQNGLSNSCINSFHQDSDGYIWISTEDGLNRFDGTTFSIYKAQLTDSLSLKNSNICSVLEDSQHRVWVGTMRGIYCMDPHTQIFKSYSHLIPSFKITSIIEDKNQNIWFSLAGKGVVCLDKDLNFLKTYSKYNSEICSDYINVIFLDHNDVLWIGSEDNGITLLDLKNETMQQKRKGCASNQIDGNNISSIAEDKQGNVIIGTLDGSLNIYDRTCREFKKVIFDTSRTNQKIYSVLCDEDHVVWVGTDGNGLKKYNIQTGKTEDYAYPLDNFLTSNSKIHNLYRDHQGNIWVGVHQKGAYLIVRNKSNLNYYCMNSFIYGKGINEHAVICCTEDDDNNVWIGTDGSSLFITERKTGETKPFKDRFFNKESPDVITALYKDSKNFIWIGSYMDGAFRYNTAINKIDFVFNQDNSSFNLQTNYVTCFAEDKAKKIWIGTNGGGIRVFTQKNEELILDKPLNHKLDEIASKHIIGMFNDSQNNMWIYTYNGLFCWLEKEKELFDCRGLDKGQLKAVIFSMVEDEKGKIWIGSMEGLYYLSAIENTYKVNEIELFRNKVINSILQDDHHNLWLGTYDGLTCYNVITGEVENFTNYDGLPTREFHHGSCYKSKGGELYFGGINGLISFQPPLRKTDLDPLDVHFTNLYYSITDTTKLSSLSMVNVIDLRYKDQIELDYEYRNFTISFAGMEFTNPSRLFYQYRMGGEAKWESLPENSNSLSFMNLAPGIYDLEIKALGGNKELVKTLRINILSPFWRSRWAVAFYILLFFFVLYEFFRRYRKKINDKEEKREAAEKQRLMKFKIDSFTEISHEIKTPLTLVIDPLRNLLKNESSDVDRKSLQQISYNINRILRLVNEVIDIRRLDCNKYILNPQLVMLDDFIKLQISYFEQTADRRGIKIHYTLQTTSLYFAFDKSAMDKILFNLISNAIKYTPPKGEISILIEERENKLCFTIKDDGPGIPEEIREAVFDQFYTQDDKNLGSGIGLYLVKKLIDLQGGVIFIENQEKGTSIVFEIPFLPQEQFIEIKKDNAKEEQTHIDIVENIFDNKVERKARNRYKTNKKVMIIEDDPDVLGYMEQELKKYFLIESASDGKSGLDKVLKWCPDIILSDVMMPGIDGLSLCRSIKKGKDTSHIPVILLTAKSSENDQLEGIEHGADLYITKPFRMDFVCSAIFTILENRQLVTAYVHKENQELTGADEFVSQDEKFFIKLDALIKKEIENPELNVDFLSRELGISRVHLHRKVKTALNNTPSDYIRNLRLRKSQELLATGKFNISEVAFKVGYTSASNFTMAFRKQFQMTPKEYLVKVGINN